VPVGLNARRGSTPLIRSRFLLKNGDFNRFIRFSRNNYPHVMAVGASDTNQLLSKILSVVWDMGMEFSPELTLQIMRLSLRSIAQLPEKKDEWFFVWIYPIVVLI
jgi:hypothetical protein